MLDSIYYLCIGKSYFSPLDRQNIRHEQNFMILQGEFENQGENLSISCKLGQGRKKQISCNDLVYGRVSEHVGKIPVVVVSPGDHKLIEGGSEDRRRLINEVLSQLNPEYLRSLQNYRKTLAQRNALLKADSKSGIDEQLLLLYDAQLEEAGMLIAKERSQLCEALLPFFNAHQRHISLQREHVGLQLKTSMFEASLRDQLLACRQKDFILQRTTVGIHKDDLVFSLGGRPIKRFGSQGQQKTYLLALKLALLEIFKKQKKISPILLLDDIFDKLDPDRMGRLLSLLQRNTGSQIFMSDTQRERLEDLFALEGISFNTVTVNNGKVEK